MTRLHDSYTGYTCTQICIYMRSANIIQKRSRLFSYLGHRARLSVTLASLRKKWNALNKLHILDAGHEIHFDNTYKLSTATSYMVRVVKEARGMCLQPNTFKRTEGCGSSSARQLITKLMKQRIEAPKEKQSTHKTPLPRVLLTSPGLYRCTFLTAQMLNHVRALMVQTVGLCKSGQCRRDGREDGTSYRGPAVRKETRDPTMLHTFLYFSVALLCLYCTTKAFQTKPESLST